jgi:hypothetical protein
MVLRFRDAQRVFRVCIAVWLTKSNRDGRCRGAKQQRISENWQDFGALCRFACDDAFPAMSARSVAGGKRRRWRLTRPQG